MATDIKTELQGNNIDLQTILNMVNELPEGLKYANADEEVF